MEVSLHYDRIKEPALLVCIQKKYCQVIPH